MSAADGQSMRRNVRLLSVGFALMTTGNVVVMSISSLIGYQLAGDKALATLPMALMWVGTATATVPASFLMRRIGRRFGFMMGAVIGMTGAAVGYLALTSQSFALFCFAVILIGAYNGFNFYFRFAAAEAASDEYRSRAISLVMAGGVAAALIGPEIAKATNDLFLPILYLGPFVGVGVIALAIFILAAFIDIPRPNALYLRGGRSMGDIARQPVFLVAVFGGAVAYGVMVMLMAVTPLAMVKQGLVFGDAALVIQWHVLSMFAPSFATGHLINRFGVTRVMICGAGLVLASIAAALQGVELVHFLASMCLLGVGWNFLFVGATTMLTEVYATSERAKTQALNEFTVFTVAAVGAFLSGSLYHHVGWQTLNLVALPPVVIILVATLWLDQQRRRVRTEEADERAQ